MRKKFKRIFNIFLATFLFIFFIGSAFAVSFVFGLFFILGFALAIYKGELKQKPWKPIAIFIGALVARIALENIPKIFSSETILDLIVSVLMWGIIFLVGWKIKRV